MWLQITLLRTHMLFFDVSKWVDPNLDALKSFNEKQKREIFSFNIYPVCNFHLQNTYKMARFRLLRTRKKSHP